MPSRHRLNAAARETLLRLHTGAIPFTTEHVPGFRQLRRAGCVRWYAQGFPLEDGRIYYASGVGQWRITERGRARALALTPGTVEYERTRRPPRALRGVARAGTLLVRAPGHDHVFYSMLLAPRPPERITPGTPLTLDKLGRVRVAREGEPVHYVSACEWWAVPLEQHRATLAAQRGFTLDARGLEATWAEGKRRAARDAARQGRADAIGCARRALASARGVRDSTELTMHGFPDYLRPRGFGVLVPRIVRERLDYVFATRRGAGYAVAHRSNLLRMHLATPLDAPL